MLSRAALAASVALWCTPTQGDVSGVTPMEKVTTLLKALMRDIEMEGKNEARTYDSFACFCKDTTGTKSTAIINGRDTINTLSAEIESKAAKHAEDTTDLGQRRAKQEEKAATLASEKARCQKEKETYEALAADLSKAISSLDKAVAALTAAQPASFLSVRHEVEKSLAFADALNLKISEPKQQAVNAFLQQGGGSNVDPDDPTYKYHSEGILKTLTDLQTEFRGKKQEADDEFGKTKKICDDEIKAIEDFMSDNQNTMDALVSNILKLKGEIATARTSLVETEALLKDDQSYLKELTGRCEKSAKEWDQRSSMRAEEIEALSGALTILKDNATSADSEVNERALLLTKNVTVNPASKTTAVATAKVKTAAVATAKVKTAVGTVTVAKDKKANHVSFLQEGLARSAVVSAHSVTSSQLRQSKVAALLEAEGVRLGSTALTSLATHASGDPFTKVKKLIQDLIERLLTESRNEATKKGFCDEELGKAYKDRDFRLADTQSLDVDLSQLEVKKDELENEISTLADALVDLRKDLANATDLRAEEKEQNLHTVDTAHEGLNALNQAIQILDDFYKNAAKSGLAYRNGQYQFLQASPVDEDTEGPGFSGAYRGKQTSSKGIIGMLHVIRSDFERTVRTTEAAEKQAHADFVVFDRTSKVDIGGKEMKKELSEADLATTKTKITEKMQDLQTAQNLLDSALKVVEGLKPTCLDTGMSYEDRVAKREEEVAALKKALCILDEQKVETECQR